MPTVSARCEHWCRKRGYKHLDVPTCCQRVGHRVTDPAYVASHGFLPFIHYDRKTLRYDRHLRKVTPKTREIHYCSHLDSQIFSYYCYKLNSQYEAYLAARPFAQSVLAYRSLGKSNIQFANEAFEEIRQRGNCHTICLDVQRFFPSINHALLKANLLIVLDTFSLSLDWYKVYKHVTTYSWIDLKRLIERFPNYRNEKNSKPFCSFRVFRELRRASDLVQKNKEQHGIPQGSPISGTLSNIYMIQFDATLYGACVERGASYRRYSDDILMICEPSDAGFLRSVANDAVEERRLVFSEQKTENIRFYPSGPGVFQPTMPLQYLGFTYDGERKLIRSSSLARFHRRMSYAVRRAKLKAREVAGAGEPVRIYKRELYERYSHLGCKRTFFRYALQAAKEMKSDAIRRQMKRSWRRLHRLLQSDV